MKFLSAVALLLVSNASFLLVGATEEQHDVGASSTPDEEPQRELTFDDEEDHEMWREDGDYEDELWHEDAEAGFEERQDHRELGGNYGYRNRGSYGRNYNPRPAPAPRYHNPAPAPRYHNPAPAPRYYNPAPAPRYYRPVRASTVYYRRSGKGKSGMGGGKSGMGKSGMGGGGRSYYVSRRRPARVISHPIRSSSVYYSYYRRGGGMGKGKAGMGMM